MGMLLVAGSSGGGRRRRDQLVTRASLAFASAMLAVTAAPAGALAAPADCATADQSMQAVAGLHGADPLPALQAADNGYQQLLDNSPVPACAKAGHQAANDLIAAIVLDRAGRESEVPGLVVDAVKTRAQTPIPEQLTTGRGAVDVVAALYRAGDRDAGDAALKQLLEDDPNASLTGELSPSARARRGFDTAMALERAGYHDAAVQVLQQTLTAYPSATPPAELANVRPAHRSPWQSDTWLTVEDWIVIGFGAIVFLLLLWRLVRWLWGFRQGGNLLIGAFSCSDGTAVGAGFSAVVGDYVNRLGHVGSDQLPDRVSKWGDPVTLPADLAAAVPSAGLVNALVGLFTRYVPTRDRSLKGTIHVAPAGVVGASITLETRSNRIADGQAVWAGDFGLPAVAAVAAAPPGGAPAVTEDRPNLLYPLAFPVAVWAFWKLAAKPEQLGSRSWQSYALFGIGEDYDAAGETEKAQKCYLEALAIDPENTPARLNLASMWLTRPPPWP